MKKIFCLMLVLFVASYAVPRPMESIENYNVLMVHGAYGSDKNYIQTIVDSLSDDLEKSNPNYTINRNQLYVDVAREFEKIDVKNMVFPEANEVNHFIGEANLGDYDKGNRITNWLNRIVFEDDSSISPQTSYIYNWRSFSNPANSSLKNAYELGSRTWNKGNKKYGEGGFGHRRSLVEEAQEVKAFSVLNEKGERVYGQVALEIIRKKPDLYRQLASRYILIGHSMGGVVSREYVQGNFYNGDVDKIITLDSPHEGTGALNMLITNEGRGFLLEKEVEVFAKAIPLAAAIGLPMLNLDSKVGIKSGIISLTMSFILGQVTIVGTRAASPEIYYENDPLVHYVDPFKRGFQTIDSLNKRPYKKSVDSLPMFRILASQNGMTFSDPERVDYGILNYMRSFIPDNYTLPIANLVAQISSSDDATVNYVNAVTAALIGIAGIPIQENGSSIVPAASSEGRHVDVLNDVDVDVQRKYFNAAPHASSVNGVWLAGVTIATDAILVIDATLAVIDPFSAELAKIAVGMSAAGMFAGKIISVISHGIDDLTESHQMPLYSSNLDTMKVAKNTFYPISSGSSSYTPYLMEAFLYERPFVNLALNDVRTLHTLDSLSRTDSTALKKSTLNRNCFYIGSKDNVKCAVGLFKSANDLNSTHENLAIESLKPLRFKSGSDWSNVGVKVDRWEKVDVPDSKGNDSLCLKVRTVPHPVKKNGQFDFIATDFYPNLLAIQKDNQNTVTISTVNKIGLSNTQRFYSIA